MPTLLSLSLQKGFPEHHLHWQDVPPLPQLSVKPPAKLSIKVPAKPPAKLLKVSKTKHSIEKDLSQFITEKRLQLQNYKQEKYRLLNGTYHLPCLLH